MDSWLDSIHQDLYKEEIDQPLLFINSYTFQYPKNVSNMMKFVKPPNERGKGITNIMNVLEQQHLHNNNILHNKINVISYYLKVFQNVLI